MKGIVKISAAELAANARRAYDAGTLQAQTTTEESAEGCCLYAGPCAIGVSVPKDTASIWDFNGISARSLIEDGKLIVPDIADLIAPYDDPIFFGITSLQETHDEWMLARPHNRDAREKNFRLALEALEAAAEKVSE